MKTALGLLCALGLAGVGCGEPPPDTSPAVRITSPTTNMTLTEGQPINVSFEVSGFDPNSPADANGKRPKFRLGEGSTLTPGVGRLVAYFNGSSIVATTTKEFEPITIPGPETGKSAADLILRGKGTITLELLYNDAPKYTRVEPSRGAEVTVNIAPK
jgi:hypothetical protein